MLCEKDDLAQGTSSRSGKLMHGGLRYLEYYEFRLVREALIEREVLLAAAPHIIWPMRFVLPHSPEDRPAWLVRLGLFLYDHLGGRKRLPGTRDARPEDRAGRGADQGRIHSAASNIPTAGSTMRGWCVLNALDAQQRGARVLTRTACIAARREDGLWSVDMQDGRTGAVTTVRARGAGQCGRARGSKDVHRPRRRAAIPRRSVRLVKGSHIVVPKFWEGRQAYLIQNSDKRVIFVNPYENDLALIGTTDIPYEGRPEDVAVEASEIDYLIKVGQPLLQAPADARRRRPQLLRRASAL